ncbi:hypothetical protein AX15_005990 [Amanita polypyramis BW_CC]|nr:hypothetical protein AX15_005990 [Amanita polypyramis BW_CC]
MASEATSEIDPVWAASRTARQIYALGEVEKVRPKANRVSSYVDDEHKDITRLLSLAASSISLLTLPQTDGPEDNLPQGEERSEQFVLEVSEYFERLEVSIHHAATTRSSTTARLSKWPFARHWLTFGIHV